MNKSFLTPELLWFVALLCIATIYGANSDATPKPPPPKIAAKFLLAVNDTWDPNGYGYIRSSS